MTPLNNLFTKLAILITNRHAKVHLRILLKATAMGTIMAMTTSITTMNMLTVIINTMLMVMAMLAMPNKIEIVNQDIIPVVC